MTLPLAAVAAHFTPDEIQVAAWYWFDRRKRREIAEWLGITRQAVDKRITAIRDKMDRLSIETPCRKARGPSSRHVRNAGNIHRII